ncbi:hypothetical protein LDENG_00243130 [Lucifuga dentata]|nr:hypothetical protein LDENG_00243130 [Lucifuga dentata]
MASTNADSQKLRAGRRPWRKSTQRLSRRLLCCSCLSGEKKDPLQEKKRNKGPQHPHSDLKGSGEAIQITVEDLGIVNPSFSLPDEDSPTSRNIACSASSVSACPRALKNKRLKPLSSLPIQPSTECTITPTNGDDDDDEEEEDPLLFESGTDSPPASQSLLTPPVINLIPPTPSDVIDDDQFLDINSEESVAHTSGSDGSFAAGDQESYEEKMESVELEEPKEERAMVENQVSEAEEGLHGEFGEEKEVFPIKEEDKDKTKTRFLRSSYQVVAPPPENPQKRNFNTGINLLPFTEHNLDDLSIRDVSNPNVQKAELCLLPDKAKMHTCTQQRDTDRQVAKSLRELSTDEVCQWFTSVGLQKCLPFIREAQLCGADVASVDVNTLDILHIATLEDREKLLSAIYNELHPPSTISQRLDSLLEMMEPNNVETVNATLVWMSKSKSSPHVSSLSMNRRSLTLRNNSQSYMAQRNSQLTEVTINVSEQIVHLRTPKETTVGKIMDSCIKMLGMTEDKNRFTLKHKQGSTEDLSPDQQIGSLLTSSSESRQLELHLCKMEKPKTSQSSPELNSFNENGGINKNVQVNQTAKEDRIRELNQQVQELHHGLVAFCSELKNMDGDVDVEGLGSAELKQRLELVEGRQRDKKESLQILRDNINNAAAQKKK